MNTIKNNLLHCAHHLLKRLTSKPTKEFPRAVATIPRNVYNMEYVAILAILDESSKLPLNHPLKHNAFKSAGGIGQMQLFSNALRCASYSTTKHQ